MDNFQFWLYVVIGAIYLLSRLRKKQAEEPGQGPANDQRSRPADSVKPVSGESPKAFSFEELMREITASKQPAREEVVVDYDDDLGEEAQDLEDVDYDYRKDDKTFETYEQAKKQAFLRPSLEETMKLQDTVVGFGKFKEFENRKQDTLAERFLKDFKSPENLKKAVVLSEILKPKF